MLKQRIGTAVVGLVIVIGILTLPYEWPWHALVWLCSLVAAGEFAYIHKFSWRTGLYWFSLLVVTLIEWWSHWQLPIVIYCFVGVVLLWPVLSKTRVALSQAATQVVGAMYIGYGALCLSQLRAFDHGRVWIWILLISIWMTDTCAYFVGRFVGGPKLWPSVSPKKTLSGSIGGVIGAAIGSTIFGLLVVPSADVIGFLVLGVVISITGQLGDLVESAYKRNAGVKDSGNFLPGHGGMLDRIDSLLFAAPFAFYLITTGWNTWFQ